MARGILKHSLRQRTSSRNDIISGDDGGGGTILPLTTGGPLSKQPKHQNMHRVGRRRRKTTRSSWEYRFKLRVIIVNIMICIIFICVVGYMFHRVVINHTHRHTLKSTQQQHVRGRQKGHTSIFSQHHNKNRSTQNHHIKTKNRRQHVVTYDFICKSHPNKIGILNDDYCDCPDGSDEPHTSACSHLLVGQRQFACNNKNIGRGIAGSNHDGSMMTYVFTSRVNDGIVDCHNNADEV